MEVCVNYRHKIGKIRSPSATMARGWDERLDRLTAFGCIRNGLVSMLWTSGEHFSAPILSRN